MSITFKPLSDNVLIDYEDKQEEKKGQYYYDFTRERPSTKYCCCSR